MVVQERYEEIHCERKGKYDFESCSDIRNKNTNTTEKMVFFI